MSRHGGIVALAIATLAASACSPCAGVESCGDAPPFVAVEGRILAPESGRPIPGANVYLVVASAGRDSVAATTDEYGQFSLSIDRPGTDLQLHVMPPGRPGYLVDPLPCAPARRHGEACVLFPMVEVPTFPAFYFIYRNDPSRLVTEARVTFVRTGGTTVVGYNALEAVSGVTTPDGFVGLFPTGMFAATSEPLVGTLTVELPDPIGTVSRANYGVAPNYWLGRSIVVQQVGPGLGYTMTFVDSLTNEPIPAVRMTFDWTAGVAVKPLHFTTRGDSLGRAAFELFPENFGDVIGDLRLQRTLADTGTVFRGVRLTAFDSDTSRLWARFTVGATGTFHLLPPP